MSFSPWGMKCYFFSKEEPLSHESKMQEQSFISLSYMTLNKLTLIEKMNAKPTNRRNGHASVAFLVKKKGLHKYYESFASLKVEAREKGNKNRGIMPRPLQTLPSHSQYDPRRSRPPSCSFNSIFSCIPSVLSLQSPIQRRYSCLLNCTHILMIFLFIAGPIVEEFEVLEEEFEVRLIPRGSQLLDCKKNDLQ